MTFLHNENYGSTLQAWALQQALRALGHEAAHIDYAPSTAEKVRNLLTSGNSPALLLDGLRKRAVKAEQAGARSKAASFAAFYAANMTLTARCRDHAALTAAAKQFDILLAGSDQIWSPVWLNPAYFLDFAGDTPRVSYAASLGVKEAPGARKTRKIRRLVQGFAAASVREAEGAALLERMTGIHADVMPDPVFLAERATWRALAGAPAREEAYIACYYIGRNSDYWARTEALAKALSLPVVVIPVNEDAYRQPYQLAEGAAPTDWLGVLAGAAHVCTDSFHGAALSVLMGTPVTILRRYREDDPESKNSRIDNLLRELGCEGAETVRPGAAIDERLAAMRSRGLTWLADSITRAAAQAPAAAAK